MRYCTFNLLIHTGDISKMFYIRRIEHKAEAEQVNSRHYTRDTRSKTMFSCPNHVMKVIGREQDWYRRGAREPSK